MQSLYLKLLTATEYLCIVLFQKTDTTLRSDIGCFLSLDDCSEVIFGETCDLYTSVLAGYFSQLVINLLCEIYLESYAFGCPFQLNVLMGVNFAK